MKSLTENAINADLKRLMAWPMSNAVIPKKSATSAAQDRVTCHVRSQPMTAEQLEELMGRSLYSDEDLRQLSMMAPSLARRVIAAEKLVEATEALAREMAFILRHNPEKDGGLYRAALDAAVSASTAYREANQ